LLSGAALAALTLAGSACAAGGTASGPRAAADKVARDTAARDTAARDTSATVTRAQARQIFDHYVATMTTALAAGDRQAALSVASGVQGDMVSAQFTEAGHHHTKLPAYRYGAPRFYRPDTTSYPQWFLASVPRTASAPTTLTGVPLAARGQVLMVFARDSAQVPWTLASSAQLAAGQALPELALTGDGHAEVAPLDATTTLARPDVTGPLQATVVDDGPASAASRAVASGPLTTGIYSYLAKPVPRYAAPRGDVRQWDLLGTNYGQFALRTSDGGALVLYAMYLNTAVEVPAELNESSPVNPGPPINVPPDFAALLAPGTATPPRVQLITQFALTFAAVDPPATASSAKVNVVAIGGAPNWASAG
jgi:hypothetical protein